MALLNSGLITFLTTKAIVPLSRDMSSFTMQINEPQSNKIEKTMRITPTVTSLRFHS